MSRLEEIKNLFYASGYQIGGVENTQKIINDFDWLINRVEELEEEKKTIYQDYTDATQELYKYREALEFYAQLDRNSEVAQKVLEGEHS